MENNALEDAETADDLHDDTVPEKIDLKAVVAQLAKLTPLEFDQVFKEQAEHLGVRAATLDREVKKARKTDDADQAMLPHWAVEASSSRVNAGVLLERIKRRLRSHVVMPEHAALTSALWVMFAWTHEAAVHSPILLVSSPEPDCGKSTLLALVSFMVPRGVITVQGTGPVVYRMIAKWNPTLIADEADKTFRNDPDLRVIFNAGWTRGAGVPRCNPDTLEPEFFVPFAPKAIGMKGLDMPDTTLTRSIIIGMQRKLPTDKADDFDHTDDVGLAELRSQLARFAADNLETLERQRRSTLMPNGFANRLAANWRLILTIADLCGEKIGKDAREAATALSRRGDEASLRIQLLRDVVGIIEVSKEKRLHSDDIVSRLGAMEDRPWAEWGRAQKPITKNQLAKMLKPFVAPEQLWIGQVNKNGYALEKLKPQLDRYSTPDPPSQVLKL
jgi:hypothetical protein